MIPRNVFKNSSFSISIIMYLFFISELVCQSLNSGRIRKTNQLLSTLHFNPISSSTRDLSCHLHQPTKAVQKVRARLFLKLKLCPRCPCQILFYGRCCERLIKSSMVRRCASFVCTMSWRNPPPGWLLTHSSVPGQCTMRPRRALPGHGLKSLFYRASYFVMSGSSRTSSTGMTGMMSLSISSRGLIMLLSESFKLTREIFTECSSDVTHPVSISSQINTFYLFQFSYSTGATVFARFSITICNCHFTFFR